MSTFRKTAREAVIFMLLGLLLSSTGAFIFMYYDAVKTIQAQWDMLWKNCEALRTQGFHSISNGGGRYTTPAECNEVFGNWSDADWKRQEMGNATDTFIPFDPSTKDNNNALYEGRRIKNLKVNNTEYAFVSLVIGAYGFAGGLGVWILYRLVRFAVKG